jgi:hypothetical protein
MTNQRSMIVSVVWTLFLDAGLAVGAYLVAHALGASLFHALLIGAAVAALRAAYVIIRRREVDAFALFMIVTFGIGLLLTIFSGSARFLLAKDSISTGISGLIFLGTLVAGRPMLFYLSQRFAAPTAADRVTWHRRWDEVPPFRAHFHRLTLVWAIALLAEALLKLILVLVLPVTVMAPIVPFFTPVLITILVIWTIRSSAAGMRRMQAERAPAAELG